MILQLRLELLILLILLLLLHLISQQPSQDLPTGRFGDLINESHTSPESFGRCDLAFHPFYDLLRQLIRLLNTIGKLHVCSRNLCLAFLVPDTDDAGVRDV